MPDDEQTTTDLAAMLAVAEDQHRRAQDALGVDESVLYGTWGVAWFVGAGLMWLAFGPEVVPAAVAGTAFFVLILGAVVVTVMHSIRRQSGVDGVSSRTGAMYGWTWFASFTAVSVIMAAASRAGASDDLLRILWTALSCLVVGALYMAAGAVWQDRAQFVIGVWLLLVGAVGALFGTPDNLLVMSVAGGGAFLVAAAVARLGRRR